MKKLIYRVVFLFTGMLSFLLSPLSFAEEVTFTSAQVDHGKDLYVEFCQICHGTQLNNGQFATPIKGFFFENSWGGKTLGELARYTWEEMPKGNGKSLRVEEYIATVAFILSNNGVEASETPMSEDFEALDAIALPF